MPRLLDLLSTLMLQSLRRTARLRARVSVWGYRGVNAVLVLLLIIPTAAFPATSEGRGLTDDEIEAAIASVADTPLSGTPPGIAQSGPRNTVTVRGPSPALRG